MSNGPHDLGASPCCGMKRHPQGILFQQPSPKLKSSTPTLPSSFASLSGLPSDHSAFYNRGRSRTSIGLAAAAFPSCPHTPRQYVPYMRPNASPGRSAPPLNRRRTSLLRHGPQANSYRARRISKSLKGIINRNKSTIDGYLPGASTVGHPWALAGSGV
ncbi:hypothetical protein EI94DRAFT_885002 [Lactarius quietus]|nr:hypothetical protein EI94DRAFT_885002 [Lactarius quietus]